jgi:AraC family transcriptional regulator
LNALSAPAACDRYNPGVFPRGLTHGRILRGRRVPGLLLAEVEYAPGVHVPRHAHEHAQFVLVLRGGFIDRSTDLTRVCEPSTLAFLPAHEQHTVDAGDSGATALIVDMEPSWLRRAATEAAIIETAAVFQGGLITHLAQRLYGEFRLRDEVSRLMIDSLTLGLVAEASLCDAREDALHPQWLTTARDLVRAGFAKRVTLGELAHACGVHPVHLARSFKQHYGCTIGDYIRELRLEFVCRRMRLSNASLAEIALSAGFADQSHLTRLFKRQMGLTPSEYRRLTGVR